MKEVMILVFMLLVGHRDGLAQQLSSKHEVSRTVERLLSPYPRNITRKEFNSLLQGHFLMRNTFLKQAIFNSLETNSDGSLDKAEFMPALTVFLGGTFAEKIDFCFNVYDLNHDHYINMDEVYSLLANKFIKHQKTDVYSSNSLVYKDVFTLAKIVLLRLDKDGDSKISLHDYRENVSEHHELMELLGHCVPSKEKAEDLLSRL